MRILFLRALSTATVEGAPRAARTSASELPMCTFFRVANRVSLSAQSRSTIPPFVTSAPMPSFRGGWYQRTIVAPPFCWFVLAGDPRADRASSTRIPSFAAPMRCPGTMTKWSAETGTDAAAAVRGGGGAGGAVRGGVGAGGGVRGGVGAGGGVRGGVGAGGGVRGGVCTWVGAGAGGGSCGGAVVGEGGTDAAVFDVAGAGVGCPGCGAPVPPTPPAVTDGDGAVEGGDARTKGGRAGAAGGAVDAGCGCAARRLRA